MKTFHSAERDEQGSKVFDFFERNEDLFNEMKWQKKLRGFIIFLPIKGLIIGSFNKLF